MTDYRVSISDQPLHTRDFFQQILQRSSDAATTISGKFDLMGYLLREHLHLVSVGAHVTINLCVEFSTPFAASPKLWSPILSDRSSIAVWPNVECRVDSVDEIGMQLMLYINGRWGFDSNLNFLWLAIGHEAAATVSKNFDEDVQTGDAAKTRCRRLASRLGGQHER